MAEVIQGVVKWAGDEKKFGNFSFNFEDRDEWFRNKSRSAGIIEPGNLVRVSVKKNKRGDLELVAAPELVSENAGGGRSSNRGSAGSASGGTDRQSSIIMQSAQQRAIAAAELLLKADGIKLSKTKTEANKVIVTDLIDEFTVKFYAAASDPASFAGERAEVEEEEQEPVEAAEEPESDDDVDWD